MYATRPSLPWWLCGLIRPPMYVAHDGQKDWSSTPSHAGKNVMLLGVHALRLISRAGGVLYNL